MDLRLLASLAALLLLAGCTSPGASPAQDDAPDALPSGSLAQEPVVKGEPAAPAPVTVQCELTRTNVGTQTGYGLNVDRAVTGIDECRLEDLFGGNTSWAQAALIEATWTAQPSQTGSDLWIESDLCPFSLPTDPCDVPSTMGASSPLALELSADRLRSLEGQNALVMASGQGFVQDLVYTFYVTLFPDPDVPGGFSAIP